MPHAPHTHPISDLFVQTPGSFRKPPVLAEARSAAADAAMGEAMPSNPPPLFLPVVFVSAGSLVGSVAHDPDSRARAIGGGSGDGGDRRGSSTDRGSKCGVDGGASGDSGGGGARGGGGGDCVAARKGSERKEPGGKGPLGGSPPRMRMPRKAVRQASFEKHTKAFGSRFLEVSFANIVSALFLPRDVRVRSFRWVFKNERRQSQ